MRSWLLCLIGRPVSRHHTRRALISIRKEMAPAYCQPEGYVRHHAKSGVILSRDRRQGVFAIAPPTLRLQSPVRSGEHHDETKPAADPASNTFINCQIRGNCFHSSAAGKSGPAVSVFENVGLAFSVMRPFDGTDRGPGLGDRFL